MDSDYRAERAEERAAEKEQKRQKMIAVNVVIYQLMESRMDPDSASGLARKISKYL